MAEAGRKNLEEWRAKTAAGTPEIDEKMAQFEADLIAEIGAPLTASQRALVDSAKLSYLVVFLAFGKLSLGSFATARLVAISETIQQQQSTLARALKQLGLPKPPATRPVPTTIDEILSEEPDA